MLIASQFRSLRVGAIGMTTTWSNCRLFVEVAATRGDTILVRIPTRGQFGTYRFLRRISTEKRACVYRNFHLDEELLGLIGNASGKKLCGLRSQFEAFSIGTLEGSRWRLWQMRAMGIRFGQMARLKGDHRVATR